MSTAHDAYVRRLQTAWTGEDENDLEEGRSVIPDGSRVRVRMAAMDATQRSVATQVSDRRNVDRVEAWRDHYTEKRDRALREERDASPAHADYVEQLNTAWRGTA